MDGLCNSSTHTSGQRRESKKQELNAAAVDIYHCHIQNSWHVHVEHVEFGAYFSTSFTWSGIEIDMSSTMWCARIKVSLWLPRTNVTVINGLVFCFYFSPPFKIFALNWSQISGEKEWAIYGSRKNRSATKKSAAQWYTFSSFCYVEVNWLYLCRKPCKGKVIKTILAKENVAHQTAVETQLRAEIVR